jgi:hypothetical protein
MHSLQVDNDKILHFNRPAGMSGGEEGASQICVPGDLQEELIKYAHEKGGHMGVLATTGQILSRFYFPQMKKRVTEILQTYITTPGR